MGNQAAGGQGTRVRAARLLCTALGALLLTSGCTVLGPDYERPEVGAVDAWDGDLHGLRAPAADVPLADWWRRFGDEALNGLMDAALRGNLDLRMAGLRIMESRALAGIAGAGRYPQVQQLEGGASYQGTRNHGDAAADPGKGQVDLGLGFSIGWELDFWGRFRRAIESADAAFLAAVENERAMQVLVTAQVAELYFGYRVTEARIDIARRNVAIRKRSYEIARALFESGNTSELDVQQARTQYLATRALIPQLERRAAQYRNALALMLGRAPGDLPELDAGPRRALPLPDRSLVSDLPARLLLRRPDVRAAAWRVAEQSARIGIAQADYYPAISLAGSLGWAGSSRAPSGASSLAVGPAFRWTLFDYGRIENNVRLQDARLQRRIEAYRDTVLRAAAEVDNAAIAVVKSLEQLRLVRETLATAERALDIANGSYREGYVDFQRVLDAQRVLFEQSDRLLVVHGDSLAAVIGLYKGLGGGWRVRQPEEMLPAATREAMKRRVEWGEMLEAPLPATPGGRP